MDVDLHRVRRTTAAHPNTPADHRHLLHAPQLEPGWTVRLTTGKSYELETNTATGTGVIQLDGLIAKVDRPHGLAWIRIFWLMPTDLSHARFRGTPTTGVSYEVRLSDIEATTGSPPTIWDPRSPETMKRSAIQARRQHKRETSAPSTHWSELGDL